MRGRHVLGAVLALAALALAGCTGQQAVLDPRGPAAAHLAEFSWLLFWGGAAIFAFTMAMLAIGLVFTDWTKRTPPIRLVVWLGLAFPVVTLLALTVYTAAVGRWVDLGRGQDGGEPPLRVDVVGQQYWWEVTYHDGQGGTVTSANELNIPVGRRVEVHLASRDVIHSFWVPSLHGKMDLIPGRTNTITIQADTPGVIRGQCAEFCGEQHALMAFFVVAHESAAFEAWLAARRQPARVPEMPDLVAGQRAFLAAGCGSCHVVRGLAEGPYAAVGQLGPDLTHVGSRLSLAAGTLPNGVGPLAAWIADAQDLKPGNRMPSFHHLDSETLTSIARYLGSLE